ncbi:MAG: sulfite oxidase [Gaiellales bacterium]|jgi:sulfite oxidase|nr:sulfite oxidase [Gaiellales bacterium]
MAAYGKLDEMIIHSDLPFNAEPPRERLAEDAITQVDRFYVRNHGTVPALDASSWRLRIGGLVATELELSLDELREGAFSRRELTATLQCAGNRRAGLMAVREIPGEAPWGPGATGTASWGGVALADVLARAAPAAGAAHVEFVGTDRSEEAIPPQPFASSIPLEKALRPEVMLAFEMNGRTLPPVHGAPVRVVVPGYIGARSVKWVNRIEVGARPSAGWFQDVAYRLLEPDDEPAAGRGVSLGEVALNADWLRPQDGARIAAGAVEARGYAFAGGERSVVRVDVSADGGRSWAAAELLEDLGRWAWRPFTARLELAPGSHELVVRAWDSAAALAPEHAASLWNPKGYVNNAWGRITVHAT